MLRKIILGLMLTTSCASAAMTCTPVSVKVEDKNIILPAPVKPITSQIYFINNTSQQGVWLDHPLPERSMSAGWSSFVQTGHWSVFLLGSSKSFAMSCAVIQPGKVDYKDCSHVVTVCTPKSADFKVQPKGSYWLAEDKPWDEIVKAVTKRGVELH